MKVVFKFPLEKHVFSNSYYEEIIQDYLSTDNGILVGWLYLEDKNYFTIKCDVPPFKSVTPLIFFDRTITKYPCSDWDELPDYHVDTHPFLIKGIGCDDGDYGWVFKTVEDANNWLLNLVKDLTEQPSFDNSYEFFDLYEDHRVTFN